MDETGVETFHNPARGWAPKGTVVYGYVDSQHHTRTNLIAAYSKETKLVAPMLYTHNCDTATFQTWVREIFLPTVTKPCALVLDNAVFHKCAKTLALLKKHAVTVLFLPPYSPHLNPIEKVWANIKRTLKYSCQTLVDYFKEPIIN